jgi:hypothetical protein
MRASELWAEGYSASVIGEMMGLSEGIVIGLSKRNREAFPYRRSAVAAYQRRVVLE